MNNECQFMVDHIKLVRCGSQVQTRMNYPLCEKHLRWLEQHEKFSTGRKLPL